MCGICGAIDYRNNPSVDEKLIRKMCSELAHRGPDDEGIFVSSGNPRVCLGHRRLSIIDLSSAGHQPMFNEDASIGVVFNGEIYNYRQIREQLKEKNHTFRSNTDTEVLIHLYEEYAEALVDHLRGMFAFAIWDRRNNKLVMARDRAGKKPALYYFKDNVFCFASEFTSLLASGLVPKRISRAAADYYFTYGYIPAPYTIYENVFKIPPAHILVLKDAELKVKRYWDLDYRDKLNIPEHEAVEELSRIMEEAVRIRLYSDVPLGAFLSGGIDSSAVVALMSRVSSARVRTFSIGFTEQDYDELSFARKVAERFGTEHHEFIVEPRAIEVLPLLVERYGEPYADSSSLPTFYVCRETKKHVTVALNGDGGDESFAGYERYQAMSLSEHIRKMPAFARSLMFSAGRLFPDSLDSKNALRRVRRFFDAAGLDFTQRYMRWVSIFNRDMKKEFYCADFLKESLSYGADNFMTRYLGEYDGKNLLDCLLSADVHAYLSDDLLVKVDIASMANSLEARSPLLDHKVMEFAARLPAGFKIKGNAKKYILRKAMADILPSRNINRKKMGFGVPVGKWFRSELKGYLTENLLTGDHLKGYLRKEAVSRMVNEHVQGRREHTFALWAMLMFVLWRKRFEV